MSDSSRVGGTPLGSSHRDTPCSLAPRRDLKGTHEDGDRNDPTLDSRLGKPDMERGKPAPPSPRQLSGFSLELHELDNQSYGI